ncbi:cytochrome P450 [Tricharina praecox]|uniref:cytochrome P450 n=1 Tax=Tricharina praecox TaxID=43433 RepID=UPI002220C35A|nr:cytochrome P450 [Tricharina praecox]KAI5857066.1 cytochrome P450 [Tricharina praecox]
MIHEIVLQLFAAVFTALKRNLALLIAGFFAYQLGRRVIRYVNSPMRRQGVPGPFLAGFTCWYRAYYANVRRNWHAKLIELHKQYGTIVWISPDEVSISDPMLRGTLYSFADERKEESFFLKAKSFQTGLFNEDFNFVFETDPARARLGKYALSHPYSEKGLSKLEHHFDEAVDAFTQGFKQHVVAEGKVACLNHWTHFFMFDLATLLMSGYSNGLCAAGSDQDGAIGALRVIFNVVGSLVPIPFALDITTRYIRKCVLNSQLEHLFRWSLGYSKGESHKNERINEIADHLPDNLMSKFRAGEKKIRKLFPQGNWTEGITNNVFFIYAGSMVASSALPAVVKLIYSHPEVLAKIREELATISVPVKLEDATHQLGECRVPYLEAAILEALRLSPTFGLSLGRQVPQIGCRLNDFFIPSGYVVSMSGWPTNINKEYFGEDAEEYKPERWLGNHPTEIAKDGTGLPRTMRNYLEAGWITWGAGSRVCIGRHLSTTAFIKFISNMVREFDVEIVSPGYLWYGLIQHMEELMVSAKLHEEKEVEEADTTLAMATIDERLVPEALVVEAC